MHTYVFNSGLSPHTSKSFDILVILNDEWRILPQIISCTRTERQASASALAMQVYGDAWKWITIDLHC